MKTRRDYTTPPFQRGDNMTTLMIQYNGTQVTGRCDSSCYDAKEPECKCVCGGSNHGKGEQDAMENTAHHALEMVTEWNTAQDLGIIDAEARPEWTWTVKDGLLKIQQDDPEPDRMAQDGLFIENPFTYYGISPGGL